MAKLKRDDSMKALMATVQLRFDTDYVMYHNITYSSNHNCQTAGVHQNKIICRPSNTQVNKHPNTKFNDKITVSQSRDTVGKLLVRLCNG